MADYGTLTITDVIMHQVPAGRRDESAADPIEYSEASIELSSQDRGFIQRRLRETLSGRARPVIEDEDLNSVTPELVRGLLSDGGDLVVSSAHLARGLYALQKHVTPVGLVMVIRGRLAEEACLVIAKMEHEQGMRVERTTNSEGKQTYRAQYLRDLILGQTTKVFKVGVFAASGARGTKLAGEVVDDQQRSGQVAEYFVNFLGCEFVQRADVMTQRLYDLTDSFIRKAAKGDPERAAEYEIALLSEMQNQAARTSPERFANDHLEADDRDEYLARVREAGLPVKGFQKDTALIASSIRRVKFQTARGASVFVPPAMYDDAVSVESLDDGSDESRIVVRDQITRISGASGPKISA